MISYCVCRWIWGGWRIKGMREPISERRPGRVVVWGISITVLLALAVVIFKSMGPPPLLQDVLGNLAKKNQIVSQMRIDLLKAVETEKSAVLAVTDEESQAFADQSHQASAAVDGGRTELGPLVEAGDQPEEKKLLAEFDTCWPEFRKIDQILLGLAVENTNLKAAALSFGKGAEIMTRFDRSLTRLVEITSSTPEEAKISRLVCKAMTAGLRIHNLHAPHIIAAGDQEMDKIETAIWTDEEQVEASLRELSEIAGQAGETLLKEAKANFAEFRDLTARVIQLSRLNSNIKSLELSLGKKRKVAAQCEETLNALQDAIQKFTFKATR